MNNENNKKNKTIEKNIKDYEFEIEFNNGDIIINIDDDDNLDDISDDDFELDNISEYNDLNDVIILSKHKIEGKHSLKHDAIFKGSKEEYNESDDDCYTLDHFSDSISLDKSSYFYYECVENENYIRSKTLKEKVYEILKKYTRVNFDNNRRKPSKSDFNNYFYIVRDKLKDYNFTNIELFNELSSYFSDNLYNMFILLNKDIRNDIIKELQQHIGKQLNNYEITKRNIHVGTEIEFTIFDDKNNEITISGIVIDANTKTGEYKVNSYKKIYDININQIKKIISNARCRYNLNKLNNIDFI